MNERLFKGECIHDFHKLPDSYVIIDTETTGLYSTDSIIQLAAIKIEHGKVIDKFDSLVRSVKHIPTLISNLTGITDDMLLTAPSPQIALSTFLDFIGQQDVVAHNAHFDINMLYDACEKYLGRPVSNRFFDTLSLARHVVTDIENHKLCTLCDYFNIVQKDAHNALDDCESLHMCLVKMLELKVPEAQIKNQESNKRHHNYTSRLRNDALTELKKIVNDYRARFFPENWLYFLLSTWLDDYIDVPDSPYFCYVYNKISSYVDDREITNDELIDLLNMVEYLCRPNDNIYNCCACDIHTYENMNVCFTGDFNSITRMQAEQIVTQLGANIKTSISRKTNYLIVGSQGSTAWSSGCMGTKILRATELISKGYDIKIVSEEVFLETIGDCI